MSNMKTKIKEFIKEYDFEIIASVELAVACWLATYIWCKGRSFGRKEAATSADLMWVLKLVDAYQKGLISTEALNHIDPSKIVYSDF